MFTVPAWAFTLFRFSRSSDSCVRLGPIWVFALVRDPQYRLVAIQKAMSGPPACTFLGDIARTARRALEVTVVPPPVSAGKTLNLQGLDAEADPSGGLTPPRLSATSCSVTHRPFVEAAFLIYYLPYTE